MQIQEGNDNVSWYDGCIEIVKDKLAETIKKQADHNLDEKYIASACRDYAETLRALEQARVTSSK